MPAGLGCFKNSLITITIVLIVITHHLLHDKLCEVVGVHTLVTGGH